MLTKARKFILTLILFYQKTLSPDHSGFSIFHPYGFCRYYPSCSEYTKQSIAKHGILKGIGYGILRIVRCNPFSPGGHDPVK